MADDGEGGRLLIYGCVGGLGGFTDWDSLTEQPISGDQISKCPDDQISRFPFADLPLIRFPDS
jgi:hypothetical protein